MNKRHAQTKEPNTSAENIATAPVQRGPITVQVKLNEAVAGQFTADALRNGTSVETEVQALVDRMAAA